MDDINETLQGMKPDDQMPVAAERMLLKPCDSVSESLAKNRRVDTLDVDKMDLDEDVVELPCIKIEEGLPLDIKALLSTKHWDYLLSPKDDYARVPISSLDSNYVIVCGFAVPTPDRLCSRVVSDFRVIEALYTDLSTRGIADDVKLVIVVKPSPGCTDASLRNFFSRAPVNCLTVPLSDSQSLNFLCETLCYFPNDPSCVVLPHLVVNPSGIVLKHSTDFLRKYGPLSFPFTEAHFRTMDLEAECLKHQIYFSEDHITVEDVLGRRKLAEIGNEINLKSTKELDHAIVGIYLYFDGEFMDKLQDIHQKCVEKGLSFDIVLVPLPFHTECDPTSFYERMKQHALKYSTSSSWLAFPFDDKICRTFWRMFMCHEEDQLIILQHDDHPGELFGKQVASSYGADAYPFSRAVVAERKLSELRSFTVESFLEQTEWSYKKNVLFHIDYPINDGGTGLRCMLDNYPEIREKYPDIEEFSHPVLSDKTSGKSVSAPADDSYTNRIFMKGTYVEEPVRPLVVVFGEDGKIVSRHEEGQLRGSTSSANLFRDTLKTEILADIKRQIEQLEDGCLSATTASCPVPLLVLMGCPLSPLNLLKNLTYLDLDAVFRTCLGLAKW